MCIRDSCPAALLTDAEKQACDAEAWEGACLDYANVCMGGALCGACDDGDPCTIGTCDAGTCVYATVECDDGDPCTESTCLDGECVASDVVAPGCPACVPTVVDVATTSGSYPGYGGTPGDSTCCLLYTSPSPRDKRQSRMPSSA